MTTYNSRLFTQPRLREIVEQMDDCANHAQEAADALAEYENASELSGEEARQAREDARELAWTSIGDLLASADRVRALRDRLEATEATDR